MDLIRKSQKDNSDEILQLGLQKDQDRLYRRNGKVYIPRSDSELQLKLLAVGHCGIQGHRGVDGTGSIINEQFYWDTLRSDVTKLVKGCLHCLISRVGEMIPRPLAHYIHGYAPNEVLHLDYLYMGSGTENRKYCLIVRDDFSSYVWRFPADAATADVAAESLLSWVTAFGFMEWILTDQGSHFKNELLQKLAHESKFRHHFTTAYSPWANGSVERVFREVLRACTELLAEWKLGPQDWPDVLESVQGIINHAPLRRLGRRSEEKSTVYRCPLEIFTGQKPRRPLLRTLPVTEYQRSISMDDVFEKQRKVIKDLQWALEGMHKEVRENVTESRQRSIEQHNRRTNIQEVNFARGDFVLVRRPTRAKHKLSFKWTGPRRILEVKSPQVFVVQDIIEGHTEVVHSRRLQLYSVQSDGMEDTEQEMEAAKLTGANYQVVEKIIGIKEESSAMYLHVQWGGLPDRIDITWEPLSPLHQDVPEIVSAFLYSEGNEELKSKAKSILQLT